MNKKLLGLLALTFCVLVIAPLCFTTTSSSSITSVAVQDLGCYYVYRTLSVGSYDPSRAWPFRCGNASGQDVAKQQCAEYVTDLGLNPKYSCRCVGCDRPSTTPVQEAQIEFMAAEVSVLDSEFVGHAFMCIHTLTSSSIKEDCYGFYPRNGTSAFIGGPGLTTSEFIKKPSRFSRVTASIRKTITEDQRRQVFRLLNEWNAKNYNLTKQNCIDFVDAVAKALGWKTPARSQLELPATYIRRLSAQN